MKHGWLLALCSLWGAYTQAQDAPLTILTHQEPPFVYSNAQGDLDGYAVQLVRGIQNEAKSPAPILLHPWARIFYRASTEPNLLVFSMVRSAERESQFHWITPITRNMHGLFANGPLRTDIHTLKDFAALPAIGVQRGDFREQMMLEAGLENIVSYTTWAQAVGALLKGRVSALFFSSAGINYYCMQLQQDCHFVANVYQHQIETTYLAMSRQGTSAELVDQWRSAATRYKQGQAFTMLAEYWAARYRRDYGFPLHLHNGTLNFWPAKQIDREPHLP
ncbi:substrate-binding periplasmic protein [Bowmanella denitrificans]|uniref:substrate-binding periplasmic protein n=1 Tax=Bowmanella denitrificans TaxID=366582 RepID=UPI000C9B67C5|nr:ABC transporter substrate-binding protein [Bowmanella denitrificans]